MLPFLSILGIFLSVILLLYNAKKFASSIYLSLFFFYKPVWLLSVHINLFQISYAHKPSSVQFIYRCISGLPDWSNVILVCEKCTYRPF